MEAETHTHRLSHTHFAVFAKCLQLKVGPSMLKRDGLAQTMC